MPSEQPRNVGFDSMGVERFPVDSRLLPGFVSAAQLTLIKKVGTYLKFQIDDNDSAFFSNVFFFYFFYANLFNISIPNPYIIVKRFPK